MTVPNVFSATQAVSPTKINEDFTYVEGLASNIPNAQIAVDAGIDQTKIASVLGNANQREDVIDLDGRLTAIEGADTASLADVAALFRPRVENLSVSISGAQASIPAGAFVTIRGSRMAIPAQSFNLTLGKVYLLKASIVDSALSVEAIDITADTNEYVLATVDSVSAGLDINLINKSKALELIGAKGKVLVGGATFDVAWEESDKIQTSFPLDSLVAGDFMFFRLNGATKRDDESDTSIAYLARATIAASGVGGVFLNPNNRGQAAGWQDAEFETDWSVPIPVALATSSFTHLSTGALPGPVKSWTGLMAVKMKTGSAYGYMLEPLSNAHVSVSGAFKGVVVSFKGDSVVVGVMENFVGLAGTTYSDTSPDTLDVESIRVKLQGECF